MANINDRTGEVSYNNFGSKMIIKEYRKTNDMDVFFPKYDYTKEHTSYNQFTRGTIACPYEARTFGIGYLGEGRHNALINGKRTKCYDVWRKMIERCYSSKYHDRQPTYIGCEVYHGWLNFQNFALWFEKNYYNIGDEQICLDKDILCKGNKIYSPDTCVFVPQTINNLFTKRDNSRGNYPVGVYYDKSMEKYKAQCNINIKKKFLGYYNTPEEAFQVYKNFKEQYIKEVAEEYKNVIPQKLYNAMVNYEVEIND